MALAGFKAQNHPQQTGKRGANPTVDDRATPPEMFGPLRERFDFTIDVAALPHNAKCKRYYTPLEDGLVQSWQGERVWCNPPYSSIEPWVAKANAEWALGRGEGPDLIVMLLPANRTEQGWWQRHVEPRRDRAGHLGLRVERWHHRRPGARVQPVYRWGGLMARNTICHACEDGDHKRHRRVVQAVPKGMLGGSVCVCQGECADGRYKKTLDELLGLKPGAGARLMRQLRDTPNRGRSGA